MDTQKPCAAPDTGEQFPDAADVSKWDSEKLLDWLQSSSPPVLGVTDSPSCRNFTAAEVSGLSLLHSSVEECECKYGVLWCREDAHGVGGSHQWNASSQTATISVCRTTR